MSLNNLILITLQHLVIGLIGFIGNSLVLMVFKKKLKDNETITFFIFHLAFTDLVCCLIFLPINYYHEYIILDDRGMESDFMCKLHTFINVVNISYSCLLMTLVAFERLFSIFYPIDKIFTILKAKIFMLILFSLCVTIGVLGSLSIGTEHQVFQQMLNNYNFSSSFLNSLESHKNTQIDSNNNSDSNNELVHKITIERIYLVEENSLINITYWANTGHCFPNNKIISHEVFMIIYRIQNSIVGLSFVVIFILYVLICGFVSKRRYLKMKRVQYYKQILYRSKQNTNLTNTKSEQTLSANISFMNCLGNQCENESSTEANPSMKCIENSNNQIEMNNQLEANSNCNIINNQINETNFEEKQNLSINDANSILELNLNQTDTNNKSTQTVNSSIAKIKKSKRYKKSISSKTVLKPKKISFTKKSKKLKNDLKSPFSTEGLPNYSNILIANIKTAFMLFVVTLIMIIVYMPAFLTALKLIEYNPFLWNIIYINNASNPFIYSFLNSNFRKNLRKRLRHWFKKIFRSNKKGMVNL